MKQLADGVWFIEAANRGRYPNAHSLYLEGVVNTLIDTGAGPVLEDLVERTDQVVLSHYHRDHVAYNHLFRNIDFAIHEADAAGVESADEFYRLSGLDRVDIEAYWKIVNQVDFTATKIKQRFSDGDYIEQGMLNVKVLHLPGHTPGHCGFLIEKHNLVFAADIDLTGFGPWYGNPSSDLNQFRQSIQRLRSIKPEQLVTGHSMPITKNIDQRLTEYESVLDHREDSILKLLRKRSQNLEQLVDHKIIYGHHYGQEVLRFFERNMIAQHLESMVGRGMVAKTENGSYEVL